jgi:hypothetical protein
MSIYSSANDFDFLELPDGDGERLAILGTPITPKRHLNQVAGASFCVSFFNRSKVDVLQLIELTGADQMLLLDNGAYSFYRKNGIAATTEYWDMYIQWVAKILSICPQAVAIAPDVIDGDHSENRALAEAFFLTFPSSSMPVYHLNEPLEMIEDYIEMGCQYLAIGSTSEYADSVAMHMRLREVFAVIDQTTAPGSGYARPWVHMLRFQSIAHLYDFQSSDSTNIAVNHSKHSGKRNHLFHLVERVKQKVSSTSCTKYQPPAARQIESRVSEIRLERLMESFHAGIEMPTDDSPIYINVPNLASPSPVLEVEQFELTG